jgi:hypothetical protein
MDLATMSAFPGGSGLKASTAMKGTDFAVVQDGRIRSVTGFLDQVPQGG